MKSKKNFLIVGLGRFGLGVIKTLSELHANVIAIDIKDYAVKEASVFIDHCAICDSTRKSALDELGVSNIDHAIVCIGNNLEATILTLINLKELGINKITVRIDSEEFKNVMERLGATEIIIPEVASAVGLANQIVSDNFLEYYKVNKDYSLVKVTVGPNFKEKSLIEIDSRNLYDVNILAILRENQFISAKGSDVVKARDVLLVFGKASKILRFDDYLNQN